MKVKLRKTPTICRVEKSFGQELDGLLREYYVDKKLIWTEIANLFGVSERCVRKWAAKLGIKSRSMSEATKLGWEGKKVAGLKYSHISCCVCQLCLSMSKCSRSDEIHKKGQCVFSCTTFTDHRKV